MSCSCRGSRSGCSRRSRARTRCCSTSRCASRSAQGSPSRRIGRRRNGCCSGWRSAQPSIGCGSPIRASTRAAPARASPRFMCWISCARSPDAFPSTRRCSARRSSQGAQSWTGRHRRGPPTPSTKSNTIWQRFGNWSNEPNPATVKGHAHYLLRLNDALRRSVSTRWARARSRWLPQDGLVRVTAGTQADARIAAAWRAAVFAVGAPEVRDLPVPVPAVGDLPPGAERRTGTAAAARSADARRAVPRGAGRVLPLDAGARAGCRSRPRASRLRSSCVDRTLADVAAAYRERLAPAIERVWREEIAALGRDLRVWVRRLPEAGDWRPTYFEFSFGLSDDGRRPAQRRPSRRSSTAGFGCAARSTSSKSAPQAGSCA